MPTYPYRCDDCRTNFEVDLSYAEYDRAEVTCPNCNSQNVRRRITRVRIAKSEDARIEAMVDPSQLSGIEDDPQALGRLMRKMGSEMGEEMDPEFDEVVSRLESGQDPEQISKEMPEIEEDSTGADETSV